MSVAGAENLVFPSFHKTGQLTVNTGLNFFDVSDVDR